MRLFCSGYILPLALVVSAFIGCYYFVVAKESKVTLASSIMGNKITLEKKKAFDSSPVLSGFGFNLFSAVNNVDEESTDNNNILLSPYCVASALSLVAAGATPSSDCQAELFAALSLKHSHEEMANLRAALLSSASKDKSNYSSGVELTMANSIWTSKSIKPEYISTVQNSHGAAAKELPSNYEPVDNWISKETNGLVKDVLSGPVDPLVVALLVSVVHFHGTWSEQFNPGATTAGTFHAPNGQTRTAKFMRATRRLKVLESVDQLGGASVLRLDYGNSGLTTTDGPKNNHKQGRSDHEFCALFILPKENTKESINQVISGLATDVGESVVNNATFETKLGSLSLPRFRIDWGASSLQNALMNKLGIKSAFTDKNVFSAMSDDPDVHLSDVIHKVIMEVTEEGTTAAAAAVAKIQTRSAPIPQIYLEFNRPFVMIVMHVPTSTPLFVGKFMDPDFTF